MQLFIFDRTGKVLSRNMPFEWLLIVISLAAAYVPLILDFHLLLAEILLHPLTVVIYTCIGAGCLWYITAGYRGYEEKLHRSIDIHFLFSTMLKSSGTAAAFKEVEIKEKDERIPESDKERFQNYKGYAYMNALFFARHRRQLIRPLYYRLAMVGALFTAAVVLLYMKRDTAVLLSMNMTALLPSFVFIMCSMTIADKAGRAMFYNCDKDLLHYAYYRSPQTILKNFKIRLLRIGVYNICIAGAVCLAAAAFCTLCGTSIFSVDMFLFCTAILLLSVLFTIHHLCMYYIFQPYSESLKVKNPFFSVVNSVVYMLCFLCLQIKTGGAIFTVIILIFTGLYTVTALGLVYRYAPKTFRIK